MTQMVATLREAPTKSALGHPRRPGVVRHISASCPNTDDCSLLMFCGSAGISLTKLEQCESGRSGCQLATLSARFHEGFQSERRSRPGRNSDTAAAESSLFCSGAFQMVRRVAAPVGAPDAV